MLIAVGLIGIAIAGIILYTQASNDDLLPEAADVSPEGFRGTHAMG